MHKAGNTSRVMMIGLKVIKIIGFNRIAFHVNALRNGKRDSNLLLTIILPSYSYCKNEELLSTLYTE